MKIVNNFHPKEIKNFLEPENQMVFLELKFRLNKQKILTK
jgi:hypothetical protein